MVQGISWLKRSLRNRRLRSIITIVKERGKGLRSLSTG